MQYNAHNATDRGARDLFRASTTLLLLLLPFFRQPGFRIATAPQAASASASASEHIYSVLRSTNFGNFIERNNGLCYNETSELLP